MHWRYSSDRWISTICREIVLTVKGLSADLYKECRTVLLECDVFDNISYLRSFCEGITPLNELVASNLVEAGTKQLLVISNLNVFLKIEHKEYGCLFPFFLKVLRDNFYDNQDELWNKIDTLRKKVIQQLEKPLLPTEHPKTPWSEHKLFESIIEIDFTEQEDAVRKALDWQKLQKRTAAFLIHGYDEKCGQKILLTRLFRKLPELKNGRQIPINLAGMSELSELWNKTASYFWASPHISGMSPEQIMDKIFECLQTQNMIFIFPEAHSTYTGFLPDLIQEFWQPIVARANHPETYLVMFLIDNKEKVCKSGVSLAWYFNNPEHPNFPLNLPPNSKFSYEQLTGWLNDAVKKEIVPQSLLAKTLLEESQGGVPELVYQRVCQYCNTSWEEKLAQWLIQ